MYPKACLIEREMEENLQRRWQRSLTPSKWYNESFRNWVFQQLERRRNHWVPGSSPRGCSLCPWLFLWSQVITVYSGIMFSISSVVFLFLCKYYLDTYRFPTKRLKVVSVLSSVTAVSRSSHSGYWRVKAHWLTGRKVGPFPGGLVPKLMILQWGFSPLDTFSP